MNFSVKDPWKKVIPRYIKSDKSKVLSDSTLSIKKETTY
jgi:hypothetical protein